MSDEIKWYCDDSTNTCTRDKITDKEHNTEFDCILQCNSVKKSIDDVSGFTADGPLYYLYLIGGVAGVALILILLLLFSGGSSKDNSQGTTIRIVTGPEVSSSN